MKVFLSWSGDESKLVAEELNTWLQLVIQRIQPWFSPEGINRGAEWFSKVMNAARSANVGLVCLTKENQREPWILFESGALCLREKEIHLGTILVDLQPGDVKSPLSHFNHTSSNKEDFRKLVKELRARITDDSLPDSLADSIFEDYWPRLEKVLQQAKKNLARKSTNAPKAEDADPNPDPAQLTELIATVRTMDKNISKLIGQSERESRRTVLGTLESSNALPWNSLLGVGSPPSPNVTTLLNALSGSYAADESSSTKTALGSIPSG